MSTEKRRGPKPKYGRAMTGAERQAAYIKRLIERAKEQVREEITRKETDENR